MTDILIISNNIKLSEISREGFNQSSKSCKIYWVTDENKAIEVVRTVIFDVVIVDADMFGKKDIESLLQLRNLQYPNHVIILSEDDSEWIEERPEGLHVMPYNKTPQSIADMACENYTGSAKYLTRKLERLKAIAI
jgi:DNA-binding response OmpR family regulator